MSVCLQWVEEAERVWREDLALRIHRLRFNQLHQVIKTAAGAGLGLLLQPIAPQPAHAVKQSKQELLLLAGAIQKEVAVLKEVCAHV